MINSPTKNHLLMWLLFCWGLLCIASLNDTFVLQLSLQLVENIFELKPEYVEYSTLLFQQANLIYLNIFFSHMPDEGLVLAFIHQITQSSLSLILSNYLTYYILHLAVSHHERQLPIIPNVLSLKANYYFYYRICQIRLAHIEYL